MQDPSKRLRELIQQGVEEAGLHRESALELLDGEYDNADLAAKLATARVLLAIDSRLAIFVELLGEIADEDDVELRDVLHDREAGG